MKLSKYRIATGHYAVGDLTIYGCYPRWQVRDGDELLEDFGTLREAIFYARTLNMNAALKLLDDTLTEPQVIRALNF